MCLQSSAQKTFLNIFIFQGKQLQQEKAFFKSIFDEKDELFPKSSLTCNLRNVRLFIICMCVRASLRRVPVHALLMKSL